MRKIVNSAHSITVDTNIFIYFLDRESPFYPKAEKLFQYVAKQKISIFTSVLTLTEVLSLSAPPTMLINLENELALIPNLTIVDVNRTIAKEAASIRRNYRFRTPDAIQLATAVLVKANAFVTNDDRLKRFKRLPVVLLNNV